MSTASHKIDFAEVKRCVSMEQVVAYLGSIHPVWTAFQIAFVRRTLCLSIGIVTCHSSGLRFLRLLSGVGGGRGLRRSAGLWR